MTKAITVVMLARHSSHSRHSSRSLTLHLCLAVAVVLALAAPAAPASPPPTSLAAKKSYSGFFLENKSETMFDPATSEQEWADMLAAAGLPSTIKYTQDVIFPTPRTYTPLNESRTQWPVFNDPFDIFAKLFGTSQGREILASVLERNFLHVRKAKGTKCELCDILKLRDVPFIATTSSLSYAKNIKIVLNGTDFYKSTKYATAEEITRGYLAGATVVINSVHYYHQKLNDLLYQLEAALGAFVGINVYMSPPFSQGFKAHHDMMDTLIFQTEGSKYWRVCNPYITLPLAHHGGQFTIDELNNLNCTDVLMVPGDVLYIPRGTIHAPYTSGNASLHLTIGLNFCPLFIWERYFETFVKKLSVRGVGGETNIVLTKPTLPTEEQVEPLLQRKEIIYSPKNIFFAEKAEMDTLFGRKGPVTLTVASLLSNILLTATADAQLNDFRRAFPVWTLVGTDNAWPTASNIALISEHADKLLELLLEFGRKHFKEVKYYIFYSGPRIKRIERRIQQRKDSLDPKTFISPVLELFTKISGYHWDKAVNQFLFESPEAPEETQEREHAMSLVEAAVRSMTSELKERILESALEDYREKLLGGLISRPQDFTSLGYISEITLGAVVSRRPEILAGLAPAHPLAPTDDIYEAPNGERTMATLVVNRNSYQVHISRIPAYVRMMESGRPFTPHDIADILMGRPEGSWKQHASVASLDKDDPAVRERQAAEKLALRLVQQCVDWGLLKVESLEFQKQRRLAFEIQDEVEEYFSLGDVGY